MTPILQNKTLRQLVKFVAVAVGIYAGMLQATSPVYFTLFAVAGAALQALTISGWTPDDVRKTVLKIAAQASATFALVLQHSYPQVSIALLVLSGTLPAFTVDSPGTAAKIEAAGA